MSTVTYKITFEGIDCQDLEQFSLSANETTINRKQYFLGGSAGIKNIPLSEEIKTWVVDFFFCAGGSPSLKIDSWIEHKQRPSLVACLDTKVRGKRYYDKANGITQIGGRDVNAIVSTSLFWLAGSALVTVLYRSNTSRHTSPRAKQTCMATTLHCVHCYCMAWRHGAP